MKIKHLISAVLALLLACSLPVTALAAEYDLAQGSVTVNASESGQTVTHGDNDAVQDDAPVIIQTNNETATTNTITIKAEGSATANVTIQDVNIVISDDSFTNHSGEAAVTIDVADGAEANVTLDGVNIDVGGTGRNTGSEPIPGKAAVQITGNGDVTLELDGENTVQSGFRRAGVEKNDADSSGKLTITDETGTSGSLEATGGELGSGIGGGDYGSGSNITITGNAEVTATGGELGSGIGGGSRGSGSYITISGSAQVEATGGEYGSGIGGGAFGSGSNITIEGSAEVTAKGGDSGSGIGGGRQSTGSEKITVSGNAQVKAQGGEKSVQSNMFHHGAGAAIGEGGKYNFDAEADPGDDVTPNTDDLNEGWIATYAPGITDLDTTVPNSLTYKDASGTVKTANQNIAIEDAQSATCTQDGHKAGFSVDGGLVAVTIPATGHSFTTYTPDPDNLATCTTAGTKTATCENCTATSTVTDPAKGHSFTNYISNPDATYDHDGTKTATCDFCDATDTIPDPGSKLVRAAAPLYRVVDQDGKALACKAEQKDGVLTVTAEADFAALTGTLGGIRTLKAQGIDTIVFVTNGATSTFAIADLLAGMTAGDSYSLTHDGDKVTFTLSSGEDIGKILK